MNNELLHSEDNHAEIERIKALHHYNVLDASLSPTFDNITRLTSALMNVPVALISFVDESIIFSKSHLSANIDEYKRVDGFCASAILDTHPYIIYDASADPRSEHHPLVKHNAGIRFYAGIPLSVQGKYNLGTLCVIDFKPRTTLSDSEIQTLRLLAKMAVDAIELHARSIHSRPSNNNPFTEQHFRSLFHQTSVGVSMTNALTGTYIEANQRYTEIVGYSALELASLNLMDITYSEDIYVQHQMTQKMCSGEISEYNIQKRYVRKDKSIVWVDLTCTALWKAGESPTTYISIVQDITDKKHAALALQENEKRWSFALDGSNQGVWDLNVVTNQIFLSPRCKEMLGYPDAQISTDMTEWVKLIHPDDIPCLVSARMQTLDGAVESFENDHRKLASDGTWKWIHVKGMVVERDAQHAPIRVIGTYTDISERKKIEDDVLRLAHYDTITNLPNRNLFFDRLTQALKTAKRTGDAFALMMLDLDRFKQVNDTLGHAKGDLLLKIISERLTSCLRESDMVARLGGDEFTIILSGFVQTSEIDHLVLKILEKVAAPCALDGDIAYVTASIGIALFPHDAIESHVLIKQADEAMYNAKKNGKNTYTFYKSTLEQTYVDNANSADHLKLAYSQHEFILLFQPIIHLQTYQMHKAEALIRWQRADGRLIEPAMFIPIAEETGQIVEIGEWVFRQAVAAIKSCREHIHHDFKISINKSPAQFSLDTQAHTAWFEYLNAHHLPGNSLIVEITEGVLLDQKDSIKLQFKAFMDAGIHIALDDFGTGYASLSNLKHYEIDYIKIDQVFIKNLTPDSEDIVLCQTIIMMAHKLNIHVIAEGVETHAQFELLKSIGCDYAQGHYFSSPVRLEDLHQFKVNMH